MALVHKREAAHVFQAAGELLEASLQRCPHAGRDLLQWEAWQPSPLTAKCWENVVVRACPYACLDQGRKVTLDLVRVCELQAVTKTMRRAGTDPEDTCAVHFKELELYASRKLLTLAKRVYPVASEQVAAHTASVAMALYDLGRVDEACESLQLAIWGCVVLVAGEAACLPPVCRPHGGRTCEHVLMLVVRGSIVRRRCAAAVRIIWIMWIMQVVLHNVPWAARYVDAVLEVYAEVERALSHDWAEIISRRAYAVVCVPVCPHAESQLCVSGPCMT